MLAIALIIIGAIFLLKNLGLLTVINWDVVWPIVLIGVGVLMLFKKKM
ncbi:MAG: DUF5668 domain-containing protein [Patescibacteria group bacterium]|jgi:hypothetical protein